jgi:hypothetical protein
MPNHSNIQEEETTGCQISFFPSAVWQSTSSKDAAAFYLTSSLK